MLAQLVVVPRCVATVLLEESTFNTKQPWKSVEYRKNVFNIYSERHQSNQTTTCKNVYFKLIAQVLYTTKQIGQQKKSRLFINIIGVCAITITINLASVRQSFDVP